MGQAFFPERAARRGRRALVKRAPKSFGRSLFFTSTPISTIFCVCPSGTARAILIVSPVVNLPQVTSRHMDRVQRLVRTWIASGKEDEVRETVTGTRSAVSHNHVCAYSLCKEITSGGATLLDVVKTLGEYLTAEEDSLRTKGAVLKFLVHRPNVTNIRTRCQLSITSPRAMPIRCHKSKCRYAIRWGLTYMH